MELSGAITHLPAKWTRLLWTALVVFFLLLGWLWLGKPGLPAYRPEDVVNGQPLQAAHGLPSGPHQLADWNKGTGIPQIKISSNFHDFGSLNTTEKAQWVFPIQNEGNAPLVIQRAYTTCECTDATFSASIIPQGKVVLVTVTFDPSIHGYPGSTLRRGVIFETNDPANPQSELWVQARLK